MLQQMDNEISSTIQNEDEIIEFAAIQEAVQDKLTKSRQFLTLQPLQLPIFWMFQPQNLYQVAMITLLYHPEEKKP